MTELVDGVELVVGVVLELLDVLLVVGVLLVVLDDVVTINK